MIKVSIQPEAFDVGSELAEIGAAPAGAVVSFTGIVRDDSGEMLALEIEHYPAMTTRAITSIVEEACARWDLVDVVVIHRFGRLDVGAQIMMVATAARHRVAAFEAAEFLMDYLKSRAPFWKREIGPDGASWVEAKAADEDALKRW